MVARHVAVLGAGSWGTALAGVLAQSGRRVSLWTRRPEFGEELKRTRENSRHLPGILLPLSVRIVSEVPEADVYLSAVPTLHLRSTLSAWSGRIPPGNPVISLSKGIERETLKRPSEILREGLGVSRLAVLSGPSHAEEVGRGMPTTLVLASADPGLAHELQPLLMTETLRIYTSPDPVGVEYAGALKNVIALAAGISDGLGLGDNAKASLISRGIVEMARLGEAVGAQKNTFFGVSGIGDLVTTCVSRHGRNLAVGRGIGSGRGLDEILGKMTSVAEGVWTSRAAQALAAQHGIEVPIIDAVCRVLFEKKSPMEAVRELMTRMPKSEREDLP